MGSNVRIHDSQHLETYYPFCIAFYCVFIFFTLTRGLQIYLIHIYLRVYVTGGYIKCNAIVDISQFSCNFRGNIQSHCPSFYVCHWALFVYGARWLLCLWYQLPSTQSLASYISSEWMGTFCFIMTAPASYFASVFYYVSKSNLEQNITNMRKIEKCMHFFRFK